ncbi:hypothetical protein TELCIR_02379 [Teladorsagia circumcincta]|uniref:Uncharacterized protein n=1 Tax=Teladorsagia circumcincta TaxID=45464 RepID=A0A2G9UZ94_TELCI|nr:hypothetical protein TELCIR_02379 [Teladorsagia circumcincta]
MGGVERAIMWVKELRSSKLTRMDRRWWEELTCILCLAIGTMCLMNGYDTQSFIVESVLHSVHMREPGTIAKHAGYYGYVVDDFNVKDVEYSRVGLQLLRICTRANSTAAKAALKRFRGESVLLRPRYLHVRAFDSKHHHTEFVVGRDNREQQVL